MKAISLKNTNALAENVKSLISSIGTALAAASAKILKKSPLVMEQVDTDSKRYKAAKKIVDCINRSYNQQQLAATARMIELFERTYDSTLPLRSWWNSKSIELTYYPPNA